MILDLLLKPLGARARADKRPPRRYYRITYDGALALHEAMDRHRSLASLDLTPHLRAKRS